MKFHILLWLFTTLLFSDAITTQKASVRATFESIQLSDSEDMGLVGLNYLLEPNDNFYYGLGMYSAVSGERGGFFVGGFTTGLKYEIFKNLYLDGGFFVGGGGGASAGQGGGLMYKTYAGVLYRFDEYSLGLNYSNITFPNGDISGNQIALVADMKFETIFADAKFDENDFSKYNFVNKKDYVAATYQVYFPKSNTLTRSGSVLAQSVKLLGVEYGLNVSDNLMASFESAGAAGGESAGYMEVLGGVGYTKTITNSSNIEARLSVGAAGGGQIDTGGGAVTKASLGVNFNPTKNVKLGLGGGYYHALEGNFDAAFAKVNLGINANFLSLSNSKNSVLFEDVSTQKFNLRLCHQTYMYSDTLSLNSTNTNAVDLFGTKIDWFLNDNLYVSGQAFGAYSGDAGGYAAGMFGLGYIQPLVYKFSFVGEFAAGAGGGGSIDVGEGSIVEPMVGIMYDITKNISAEVMYGKVIALNGNLDSNLLEFGFVYKFNKLVMK